MDLSITRKDGKLALVGSVDLVSRQSLVDAGKEVLDDGEPLALDLAGVDFMDSVGIGALVELSKAAASRGQRFTVAEVSPVVGRILQVTGLDGAWTAEGTAADSQG
ncbi:hypothetical protein JCM18899A_26770 [Nocardioides sp. AN3]